MKDRIRIIITFAVGLAAVALTSMVGRTQAASNQSVSPLTAPTHYTITAGWGNDDYAANIYTPHTIQIYAGDTVTWRIGGLLEPHTITFGPQSLLARLAKNSVVPETQKNSPPKFVLNPQASLPTRRSAYDGTGFANSGLLAKGQKWTIAFTKPGTYRYYCLIHYPGMFGVVKVLPRPSSASGLVVNSGYGPDTSAVDAFFPDTLTIHVGQTVTWSPGFHTVSFGSDSLVKSLRQHFIVAEPQKNGPPRLVINPKIALPSGGPTYGGQGFLNSGLLVQGPFKVTFTKPGTYRYYCLIHPGMDGTIRVLP